MKDGLMLQFFTIGARGVNIRNARPNLLLRYIVTLQFPIL